MTQIEKYNSHLKRLKMTMFADDTNWKQEVETLILMLVEDRIEILRHKHELLSPSESSFADSTFTGDLCPDCGEPQFTCPSGVTCENGHGF